MKSLPTFQNPLNFPSFPSNEDPFRAQPDLASQLLGMLNSSSQFDATTILGKRQNTFLNNTSFQPELQKKLKVANSSLGLGLNLGMPSLTSLMTNLNQAPAPPAFAFGNNSQLIQNLVKLQQLQSLGMMLPQSQLPMGNIFSQNPLLPTETGLEKSINMDYLRQKSILQNKALAMKDAYSVKIEEGDSSSDQLSNPKSQKSAGSQKKNKVQETTKTEDTASEISTDKSTSRIQEDTEEPALTELTKVFPDWDLATIFNFMRSGKSQEAFETQRQVKLENKKKRGQKRREKLERQEKLKAKKGTGAEGNRAARANRKVVDYDEN